MKRFILYCSKTCIAALLAFMCMGLTMASNVPISYAAAHRPTAPLTGQSAVRPGSALAPDTSCVDNSPTADAYVVSRSGMTVTYRVEWNCSRSFALLVWLDYGDGAAPGLYTCGANCTSGSANYTHTYTRHGEVYACPEYFDYYSCADVTV